MKLFIITCCHTHNQFYYLGLTRETSFCSRYLTQTPTIGKCAKNERLEHSFLSEISLKTQKSMWKGKQKDRKSQRLWMTRGNKILQTQQDWLSYDSCMLYVILYVTEIVTADTKPE